jgi:hypothetical protein
MRRLSSNFTDDGDHGSQHRKKRFGKARKSEASAANPAPVFFWLLNKLRLARESNLNPTLKKGRVAF